MSGQDGATLPRPTEPTGSSQPEWHEPAAPQLSLERRRAKLSEPAPVAGVDLGRLRRKSDNRRLAEPYPGYFFVSEGWAMTAPAMALACLLVALWQYQYPDIMVIMPATAAVVLAALCPAFVRFERSGKRGKAMRHVAMAVGVALPMGLFGLALALWQQAQPQSAMPLVGSALVVGLVASVVLNARPFSLVAANLALWAGPAFVIHSLLAVALLLAGAVLAVVSMVRQLALDHAAQAELREMRRQQLRAEEILSDFERTGQGWFWETDRKGILTYVSSTIPTLLGREQDGLIGHPLTDLFQLEGQDSADGPESDRAEGERSLQFHLNARSPFQDVPVRAASAHEERWWSVNGRPVYDNYNNFLGFRGSGSDLTEKRRSEQQATRLAHFDSLTGLANRFQMSQTLEKILAAPKAEHRDCTVFLLDLDRFKQVNDTMGHPAGDALLKQVAQRLQRTVGELGLVGRLGGDEFEVILPGRVPRDRLAILAQRIIEGLSQPYLIEGARAVIGASLGIAIAPDHGASSEAIIRNADLALYAAKDRGRGCFHFYAADLHSEAEERHQLENDLRDALSHGGLELYYQPVVAMSSQTITGFEALLRWNHPRLGQLSPTKFIGIAEDTGLIAQIGEWAIRSACHDLARWPSSVRVAVNVSPLQFSNPQLPSLVAHALASAQVDPARLELEITESVFLNDSDATEAMFAALKRIGVRLALDDFGTGYSSLGYLKKAPFDKIKIDQGFVRGATMAGSRNGAIIASIVSLAEALGMETTAEGVETMDELALVRELGCSHVQGYIYAKPLPREEADEKMAGDLAIAASGPRSARPARRTMLRKVTLAVGDQRYPITIRNISETGAMFEGLMDVPIGLAVMLELSDDMVLEGTVRWSKFGRTGVEFAQAISFDAAGSLAVAAPVDSPLRRRSA